MLSLWSYKCIPVYYHSLICIQVLTRHLHTVFSKTAASTCEEFCLMRSSAQICYIKLFWKGQSEQNEPSGLLWAQKQYELMFPGGFNSCVKT